MDQHWRGLARWAAVGGVGVIIVYLVIALPDGGDATQSILLLALLMAIPPALCWLALTVPDPVRARTMLYVAAFFFAVFGWASALSIGILFLIAAGLSLLSAARATG